MTMRQLAGSIGPLLEAKSDAYFLMAPETISDPLRSHSDSASAAMVPSKSELLAACTDQKVSPAWLCTRVFATVNPFLPASADLMHLSVWGP